MFNQAVRDGTAGEKMRQVLQDLQRAGLDKLGKQWR
jgi:hypothetical protein